MSVSAVSGTSAIAQASAIPKTSPPGADGPALLPPPAELGADPMTMLFLFQSKSQDLQMNASSGEVKGLEAERNNDLNKEQQALANEAKAAKHKSFWDKLGSVCADVAKVAGVVASVAAAVATCGAGTPLAAVAIAGAVMSTAGFLDSETNVLQKLGVSAKLATIVDSALGVGGAICSVGVAGAVGAVNAARVVTTTAAVVSGVGEVGSGVSAIGSGYAQRDEDRADATAVGAEADQNNLERMITRLVQEAKDSDDQTNQILDTIAGTKNIENQTSLAAATAMKG
jgi:hypothetical protein